METGQSKAHFSIPSIIAIGAAIASYFVNAVGGFILALVAIFFGVIGAVMALFPGVRGGFVSVLSLLIAAVALVVAVIKAVAWLV